MYLRTYVHFCACTYMQLPKTCQRARNQAGGTQMYIYKCKHTRIHVHICMYIHTIQMDNVYVYAYTTHIYANLRRHVSGTWLGSHSNLIIIYTYIHIYSKIYMYICIYVYVYKCMFAYAYICIFVYVFVYIFIHICRTYAHVHINAVSRDASARVYINFYIYIYTLYMHIRIYIYKYTCVYTCKNIFTCTYVNSRTHVYKCSSWDSSACVHVNIYVIIYIHACIYVDIYIHIYTYIYVYM